MTNSEDMYYIAHDQDANVTGAAVNAASQAGYRTTRGDGITVDLTTANGLPPNANAVTAVMGADVSDAAVEARALARDKQSTIDAFLADNSPVALVTRALAKVMKDELNNHKIAFVVGSVTASWNPPSVASGAEIASPTMTLTGAVFTDEVHVLAPYSLQGCFAWGFVTAADTVGVRVRNGTGAAVDLPSGTWEVVVTRFRVNYTNNYILGAVTDKIQAE